MDLAYVEFQSVDLNDPFFDSLKADYAEFEEWFVRKSNNRAFVHRREDGSLDGFLFLKLETEALDDISPSIPARRRLKVGTFKIDAHGTRLGERFVKKIFDFAIAMDVEEIYVTIFEKHEGLNRLLECYGLEVVGSKTTSNGTEQVRLRKMAWSEGGSDKAYPFVKLAPHRQYLLSIQPRWHTRLLPDSILKNETSEIIEDVSHANSIHKVYLAAMRGLDELVVGDTLLIYRTSDEMGAAYYRSVVTSVCVVEEVRNISTFANEEEFIKYCRPYSVFKLDELKKLFQTKRYPNVIRFTYNFALRKRLNRKILIEEVGLDSKEYWGFMQLSTQQFREILKRSETNESLVVD